MAGESPAGVFAGAERTFPVLWHNPADQPIELEIRARLYQAAASLAMPLSEVPWKRLRVLAGQTVLESATIRLPDVRAETRFLVQWIAASNHVLGVTELAVYPANLLEELKTLAGDEPLAVFDPLRQLRPLLQIHSIQLFDLEISPPEDFRGRLAILGSAASEAGITDSPKRQIKALAKRPVAVVWLQPPPDSRPQLLPSFSLVHVDKAVVVAAQPELTARLADDPRAQLNLVRLARLALKPDTYPFIRLSSWP